jgi:RNase P subunit RPR2
MAKKKESVAKPAGSWFDERSHKSLIESQARQLNSFIQTFADGKVDQAELKAQEERLINLMKEIEPKLDTELHEKVTRLLCELTAFDLMQMVHAMQAAKPKTKFRG